MLWDECSYPCQYSQPSFHSFHIFASLLFLFKRHSAYDIKILIRTD